MKRIALTLAAVAALTACSQQEASNELVIYSARNETLMKPILDKYTEKTGTEFQLITDKEAPLLERLKAEGENTPADILITVDAGNLWHASENGVLASVESDTLNKNIPANLKSSKNDWFGFSVRARTIVYNTDAVDPSELSTYEDLATEKWKDRLCLRTSKKVYNQSLVATLISTLGEDQTQEVVEGWVSNLATDVFSSDTKMMEAVNAGQCDVGIGNTYYYGRLQAKGAAENIALFWPNQNDRGVHVNVSGAGKVKHAKHPENAVAFLEWLSSPEAQEIFAGVNYEFPANSSVPSDPLVAGWGTFKQDIIDVETAGSMQADAVKLMDRAGYL